MTILSVPSKMISFRRSKSTEKLVLPNNFHYESLPLNLSSLFFLLATNIASKKKKDVRKTRLCRALMMMLPMLFTSCLAQFLLLYKIFVSASFHSHSIHSNSTNPNSTSTTGVEQNEMMPLLQTVCVVLFTLDMMNQYCALSRSSMVPFASHFKLENSETFYELRIPVLKRVFMYLLVGLTEFTVWFCLLLVGLFFLVTTTDSTSLILDTLALNFITQIDEYIFSATI